MREQQCFELSLKSGHIRSLFFSLPSSPRLFDKADNEVTTFKDVKQVFSQTTIHQHIPIKFVQFLLEMQLKLAWQVFIQRDQGHCGSSSALDFRGITIWPDTLPAFVEECLVVVAGGSTLCQVSFSHVNSCNLLLNNMKLVKKICRTLTDRRRHVYVTKAESYLKPLTLLFTRHVGVVDVEKISPLMESALPCSLAGVQKQLGSDGAHPIFIQVAESVYRLTLGSVAGGKSHAPLAPCIFTPPGRHPLACLVPQLLGVALEKAIKLTVSHCVRKCSDTCMHISDRDRPLSSRLINLCFLQAAGSHVTFTNPLVIIRIHLQVAGQVALGPGISALSVNRDLGYLGLCKGSKACFLWDIPFSAIYFPCYAHTKLSLDEEDGRIGPAKMLFAGALAGIPETSLVTPADVIKTRLQVVAHAGLTTYSRRSSEERALVFRSTPLFGVTPVMYGLLKPAGSEPTPKSRISLPAPNPNRIGGFRLAMAMFTGIVLLWKKMYLFLPLQYTSLNRVRTSNSNFRL
uniref:Uncharacterized protein n=1 Tax=Monopterus albus TaxID=43700 RepID=A0A3Q3R9L5_MONAL